MKSEMLTDVHPNKGADNAGKLSGGEHLRYPQSQRGHISYLGLYTIANENIFHQNKRNPFLACSSKFQMGVLDPSQQDKETLMSTLMTSVSEFLLNLGSSF